MPWRERLVQDTPKHGPCRTADCCAGLQVLINLRTQFENIMKALKDPRSLVNSIFRRAQERIAAMVADAGLDLAKDADRAVFNFALQVRSPASCRCAIQRRPVALSL